MQADSTHVKPEEEDTVSIGGDAASYVHHNKMHLHGAIMQMVPRLRTLNKLKGMTQHWVIPVSFHKRSNSSKAARTSTDIQAKDSDERPYQFGVIAVLGGSDHDKLTKSMTKKDNSQLVEALGELGLVTIQNGYYTNKNPHFVKSHVNITPILFNNMGYVMALEVAFDQTDQLQRESTTFTFTSKRYRWRKIRSPLREGRTGRQANALSANLSGKRP